MKNKALSIIDKLASKQEEESASTFVAPCVHRGRISVSMGGVNMSLRPSDSAFEGWGVFRLRKSTNLADLEREAGRREIAPYLSRLPMCRFRLCFQGLDKTWAGLPYHRGPFESKFGPFKPVALHLVGEQARFDLVKARFDGTSWWFEGTDRIDIPAVRRAMCESYDSGKLRQVAGIRPEDEEAFKLAVSPVPVLGISCPPTDEERIKRALTRGGGKMLSFVDRGDFWNVVWTSPSGRRSTSSIMKSDMTVMASGMCLSGRDKDFDLQTLVDVVEKRDDGM
jgi:hypothetical protein